MADQGTIGYDACTLGQGEADLLLTQDSIVGGFDACVLGQGILVHSVIIAWTES